jgi:hypothetical protein
VASSDTRKSPVQIPWEQYDQYFGKLPDSQIRQMITDDLSAKIGRKTVSNRRISLGIRPVSPPPKVDWQASKSLLGSMPDSKVAKMLGVAEETVYRHRKEMGIPSFRSQHDIDWSTVSHLLGTDTDKNIANELGTTEETVMRHRNDQGIAPFAKSVPMVSRLGDDQIQSIDEQLGIRSDTQLASDFPVSREWVGRRRQDRDIPPAPRTGRPQREWTPEEDALLGTDVDAKVASQIGVSVSTVFNRRTELNIEPFGAQCPKLKIQWTPEMDQLLGTDIDKTIAEQLGVSAPSVWNRRTELKIEPFGAQHPRLKIQWTPEMDQLLGTDTDKNIAEQLGVSAPSVWNRRAELKIEPFENEDSQQKIQWTTEMDQRLGTNTDKKIAEDLGISYTAVNTRRNNLNIPSFATQQELRKTTLSDNVTGQHTDSILYSTSGEGHMTPKSDEGKKPAELRVLSATSAQISDPRIRQAIEKQMNVRNHIRSNTPTRTLTNKDPQAVFIHGIQQCQNRELVNIAGDGSKTYQERTEAILRILERDGTAPTEKFQSIDQIRDYVSNLDQAYQHQIAR